MITPTSFRFRILILLTTLVFSLFAFVAYDKWTPDGFRGQSAASSSAETTQALVNPGESLGSAGADKSVPKAAAAPNRSNHQEAGPAKHPGTPATPENLMLVANRQKPDRNVSTRAEAAQGRRTIAEMFENADMSDPVVRARVVAEMEAHEQILNKAVEDKARRLGIPLRIDGPGHKISMLYDFRGDEPIYRTTLNSNAAISSAANLLTTAPYSLDGTNIKVAVWDEGSIRSSHQEFAGGRVTKKNPSAALSDHATHVGGTIGATGIQPTAKGMAPMIKIDSYDWNSDYAEMTAAGAATAGDSTHIGLSNHSYGYGSTTADMGRYETECRTVDTLVAALPYYMPFWAAGNSQDELTAKGGFQSITYVSLAKNILTVGATHDAVSGGLRSPPAATITYFSSLGPCDDGRIKPDLVGNGWQLNSTISTGDTAYNATYSGTSMASPNVMGSAALVEQLYAREFSGLRMRASMMKALLIQTADDLGNTGPDYKYGWGLINVKAASDLILAHKGSLGQPKMIEGTITNAAKTATHTFSWDGASPIRATLCWTDPAGAAQTNPDSRTPNLIHNLDAKITAPDGTTVIQPYVMPFVGNWSTASMASPAIRGKNNVDNVEQVYLAAPVQAGLYTITISLDGTLTNSSQAYSLVISGGSNVELNPPPSVALTSPVNGAAYLPGAPVTVSANASDFAIGNTPGSVTQVEFFSGTTSLGVDTSAPYSVDWMPSTGGTYSLTARATDSEGAESTSAAVTITVLTGNGTPVISSFTPTGGLAGAAVVLTGLNFINVSSVKFNGSVADFIMNANGTITATLPATASTGTITVTNSYGTGTSAGDFTVSGSPVLISQIYGAGGNTGATYNRDYVEIRNASLIAINLAGWSLQYASATGPAWSVVALSGTIAPGKHRLIGLATGSTGAALPTVDLSGTISMNASSGKVALRSTPDALTGFAPLSAPGLMDFVGYGLANAFEGTAPAPSPSTTTAIFRANDGATDTGNNSVDFYPAVPNPRNSSAPAPVVPSITSSQSPKAAVGSLFSYQIIASNFPTSYSATGLPPGLTLNPSTGLISGIPTTAAEHIQVVIFATNSAGTGNRPVDLRVYPIYTGLPGTIFSENMGTPAAATQELVSSYQGYQNYGLPYAFAGTANVIKDTPSSGYTGASGNGNVIINNVTTQNFVISGINTSEYSDLSLSFGQYKSTTVSSPETLAVEYSTNGTSYTALKYTRTAAGGTWQNIITPTGAIPSAPNLRIRFRQTSTSAIFRIDDVVLTGIFNGGDLPIITTAGALTATNATYGSASATPASFTVSGVRIPSLVQDPGIKITAPPGFEISKTEGDATGYAATQTIAGTGTIAPTTVYLRLAAGNTAGSYSGNVVCTSGNAAPVNMVMPVSEVRPKLLTVRADSRNKKFGETVSLGTTAFTSSGLVSPQNMGNVTLTASGGTAANDDAGTYLIVPSAARSGTFDANNYDIDYVSGTLTVTPRLYADWLTAYPGLADTSVNGDSDRDGITNLMEYYNGTHPGIANVNDITVGTDATTLSMTYRRAKGIGGVTGTVKWSHGLTTGTWSANGVSETSQDMGTYEKKTATVPRAPEEAKKFMHLEVSQP